MHGPDRIGRRGGGYFQLGSSIALVFDAPLSVCAWNRCRYIIYIYIYMLLLVCARNKCEAAREWRGGGGENEEREKEGEGRRGKREEVFKEGERVGH